MKTKRHDSSGLVEAIAVGGVSLAVVVAVFVTYARFPADRFYHVSGTGLTGGASRALVFLNFPLAFVAIALLIITLSRLLPVLTGLGKIGVSIAAIVSTALCLVATISVRQSNLDADWLNAVPAIGVAIIVALMLITATQLGVGDARPWRRVDTGTLILGVILLLLGLPWVLANLGIYAEDIPGLGRIVISVEQHEIMVHLGDHHGFDGMFLALVALALIRVVGTLSSPWMNRTLSWYLAFMLVYGLANMRQDFWGEQVVKRGWSERELTSMMIPALDRHWAIFALLVVIVWAALFFRPRVRTTKPIGRPTYST